MELEQLTQQLAEELKKLNNHIERRTQLKKKMADAIQGFPDRWAAENSIVKQMNEAIKMEIQAHLKKGQ